MNDATITLTGHSLGGGLAALVGVFFGVQAVTFDQAPFAESAELNHLTPDVAANLRSDLAALLDANGNRLYDDAALSGLTNFLQQRQLNGGIPNSDLVTNNCVEGEFLSEAPATVYDGIGTEDHIPNNIIGVGGTDLHSHALLAAYLQSRQTAEEGKALNDVTYKLSNLLGMFFDKNLYAYDTDEENENFLERLVKHEAGVHGSLPADAMVTRFTSDLWKLAQDGGLTMRDANPSNPELNEVSKSLIAFAMQMYYENTANATDPDKELFDHVAGGIRFDIADVSEGINNSITNGDKVNLDDAKRYKLYFRQYLAQTHIFSDAERQLIQSLLPSTPPISSSVVMVPTSSCALPGPAIGSS